MKIALFGGAFDPPHNGHALVADTLIENEVVDQVWFVPVFEHPWADRYQKQLTAYEDRVAMLELLIANKPAQQLDHFKDVSYTYDTLQYFRHKYPEHHFFWLMGSEYLSKFEDFLVDHPGLVEFPFLVYPRAGFELQPIYGNMMVLDQLPIVKISSTMVRERLADKQEIIDLVDRAVADYITTNELYPERNSDGK